MFLGIVWSYYSRHAFHSWRGCLHRTLSGSMTFVFKGPQSQALNLVRLANAFKEKVIPLPTSLWHPFFLHL